MADLPITDAERTRKQGRQLKRLRERTGVTKGRLMDAVGLTTTNGYDLYERGISVIRLDRVEDWAAAFGLAPLDFVAVILELRSVEDALAPSWSFREALTAAGVPADEVDRQCDIFEGRGLLDQKAAAATIIEEWQRERARQNRPA